MRPASYSSLKPWMSSAASAKKRAFQFFPARHRGRVFRVASSAPAVRFVAWKPMICPVIDGFLGQG